jgi:hypothetical protein
MNTAGRAPEKGLPRQIAQAAVRSVFPRLPTKAPHGVRGGGDETRNVTVTPLRPLANSLSG